MFVVISANHAAASWGFTKNFFI